MARASNHCEGPSTSELLKQKVIDFLRIVGAAVGDSQTDSVQQVVDESPNAGYVVTITQSSVSQNVTPAVFMHFVSMS